MNAYRYESRLRWQRGGYGSLNVISPSFDGFRSASLCLKAEHFARLSPVSLKQTTQSAANIRPTIPNAARLPGIAKVFSTEKGPRSRLQRNPPSSHPKSNFNCIPPDLQPDTCIIVHSTLRGFPARRNTKRPTKRTPYVP